MHYKNAINFIRIATRPFIPHIVGFIIIACAWAFLLNVQPYIVKKMLDKAMYHDMNSVIAQLSVLMALYLLCDFIIAVIFRLYDFMVMKFRPCIKKHIGTILMDSMMEHSYNFYQHQFAGNLTTRIGDIVVGIPDILRILIDRLLASFLMLLFALCNMSLIHIKFAIALGLWIFVFLGIAIGLVFFNQHLAYDVAQARAVVTGQIVDVLTNMASVRLFSGKKYEHKRLEDVMEVSVKKDQARDWFFFKLYALQGVSFLIFQGICFWWLLQGLSSGMTTPGDFVLVITLNIHIVEHFWHIANEMREFWEKLGNIVQGLDIIKSPIEIKDKKDAKDLVVTKGEIVFNNVQFQYEDAESLFEHESVVIQSGQKVGLVGYSGSGKSTFVNLILRLFDVSVGSILIDGQDIRDVTQESLHRHIAMIPQDPSLFHRTIFENIKYGNKQATQEEVITAAKKAYAHEFITELSQGYNMVVGERGVKLSGGQRQRIVIARAILKNAPILILDEATSQLDSIAENEIQESLWNLMQHKTTLVIAHRLSTLLHMDRILVFNQGSIVEDGSHEQLLRLNGLYKQLWEAQVGGFLDDRNDNLLIEPIHDHT